MSLQEIEIEFIVDQGNLNVSKNIKMDDQEYADFISDLHQRQMSLSPKKKVSLVFCIYSSYVFFLKRGRPSKKDK